MATDFTNVKRIDTTRFPQDVCEPSCKKEIAPDPKTGIGGAPTRATTLPVSAEERKKYPVASGVLDYFPDAIVAISNLSYVGNLQHNPGQSLNWARGKSTDESDTMMRHFLQRGTLDTDGVRHSVKMAWRALAFLQKELEEEQAKDRPEPPEFEAQLGEMCKKTNEMFNEDFYRGRGLKSQDDLNPPMKMKI